MLEKIIELTNEYIESMQGLVQVYYHVPLLNDWKQ